MLLSEAKKIQPIYTPNNNKPMHVVVFGSGSGTNLEALLKAQKKQGSLFQIQALFTDRQCRFQEIAERENIPLIYHSFGKFFKERGVTNLKDSKTRTAYEETNIQLLKHCAEKHNVSIDLIVLAGYMRLLYPPMLETFSNKIINVHPADLTVLHTDGKPQYVGANALFTALRHGEKRTRSSVILVNEHVDQGPILVSGPWLPYSEGYPITTKKAACHQEKQKRKSDWIATEEAVKLIAKGRLALDEKNRVYLDGHPTEKGGVIIN